MSDMKLQGYISDREIGRLYYETTYDGRELHIQFAIDKDGKRTWAMIRGKDLIDLADVVAHMPNRPLTY